MSNKHVKNAPHHMSLENCKLKQQDATTHLLERSKSGTLIPPNADKDLEQHELSDIASKNVKWYSPCGRQFGSFLQS